MAFPRSLEGKSVNLTSSNNTGFFAPKTVQVSTLKELSSIKLIERVGSDEEIEGILIKIKKLHGYVIKNNLHAVDEFLSAEPRELLPVLLKTKSINQTSAKGLNNHVIVEGTALGMAIGAKAVGRDGCDLCLLSSHFGRENTTLKKLALYSDSNPDSPFRYVVEEKEFNIGCGYGKGLLAPFYFPEIKAMFKNPLLYNTNLNLDHPALNKSQRAAYAALLRITEERGHTSFVKEEGMVELLQRHIRRALPGYEGEHEIARQTLEQFPEGWEEKEDKQFAADYEVLRTIRKALADSTSGEDPKLEAALDAFRNYLEPEAKEILRTGTYGKERMLLAACEIGFDEFFYNERKDEFWCEKIVGWLERLQQDNVKQDMAQGLRLKFYRGMKSNYSLKYTWSDKYFDLSGEPRSGIGYDSWACVVSGITNTESCGGPDPSYISMLSKNQNSCISKMYAAAKHVEDKEESANYRVAKAGVR